MNTGRVIEDIMEEGSKHAPIEAWVDRSMYEAAPMERVDGLILPKVHLLEMSPDPLGNVAAMSEMYKGNPITSRSQITDDMRREHLQAMLDTHLTAPLENIKYHFMVEGVDRSFTHQLVRIRTADYAQESLRFAVKTNLAEEVCLPPSLAELPKAHPTRQLVDEHNEATQTLYNYLVANGIPAEDARAYLPHAVATRIHFIVDMRNLIHHAGNRLCTQAQFVWRDVFLQMRDAVRTYTPDFSWWLGGGQPSEAPIINEWNGKFRWQFEALTDTVWWKPACYQMGHCPFNASFDRGCTIRDRVQINASVGRDATKWHIMDNRFDPMNGEPITLLPIEDVEWAGDRTAAYL